jgi:hypothetical protein
MTVISFSDGRAVMRDGKVGTEQECCCCCVTLYANPNIAGAYQEDWDNCFKPVWQTIQGRLADAGWTATINESPGVDPNGDPLVLVSMTIEPCCGLSCADIIGSIEGPDGNGAFSVADGDGWVDTQSFETFNPGPGCGFINFGEITVGGCCGLVLELVDANLTAVKVFTAGGAGDNDSAWIPVCNPLP